MKRRSNFSRLMRIGNEMRRSASVSFIPEPLRGMNVTQMGTLSYISDHEEEDIFQKDIESYLRIRRSSVSSLLNNMEKGGLLRRLTVPEDARLKRVVLTEEGQKLCRLIEEFTEQVERFVTKVLTREEADQFASILEKIVENLDQLSEEANQTAPHQG